MGCAGNFQSFIPMWNNYLTPEYNYPKNKKNNESGIKDIGCVSPNKISQHH